MTLALQDVLAARRRIAPHVAHTPLVRSWWLANRSGGDVSLKLEALQPTYSFKIRGAFNAVMARLEQGGRPERIVTASAGNHGRALALAAETFSIPLVVFTPIDAPRTKLDAIKRHGATLRAEGRDYDEAERMAKDFARADGGAFVSAYSDPDVIAGAATVALEILEDKPDVDTLVVPIGGGGLLAGMAAAAKAIEPAIEVIGVEAAASTPFSTSLKAGRLVTIVPGPTLADGLAGNPDPDTITFDPIQRFVDRVVTVTEDQIVSAIVGLVEAEHVIAEGAGAVAPAAVLGKAIDLKGRRAAVVVSGGNIDRAKLAKILAAQ